MKNSQLIKLTLCFVLVSVLCFVAQVHSEEVDPFRDITPKVEEIQAAVEQLSQPREQEESERLVIVERPDLYMETVLLKFLTADKELKETLEKMVTEFGAVSIDVNTNSMVICDSRESLDQIVSQLRKIDRTPKQVLVEVVILDVTLSDDTEIGVNWANLFSASHTFDYSQQLSNLTTGGTLTIMNNDISATVKALQKVRNVEILASPRVLVVSGQEATIETVEEIPYEEISESTGGAAENGITSTEFKDAGISLKVKPIITDEGKILMHVRPNQSVDTGVPGLDSRVPIVNRRGVDTTLLLNDGQLVVIGGLRRKDTKLSQDKIPLLGDLPLIGFLFSSDKVVITETELVILISPHIYDTGPVPTKSEIKKFNELKDKPMLKIPRHKDLTPQIIQPRPEFEIMQDWIAVPHEE